MVVRPVNPGQLQFLWLEHLTGIKSSLCARPYTKCFARIISHSSCKVGIVKSAYTSQGLL